MDGLFLFFLNLSRELILMNWMIIVVLAIPYFYLLLLVNLNQGDVKKLRSELIKHRSELTKLENVLRNHSTGLDINNIRFRNDEIAKRIEEMRRKGDSLNGTE
jgi:hypothetical protein